MIQHLRATLLAAVEKVPYVITENCINYLTAETIVCYYQFNNDGTNQWLDLSRASWTKKLKLIISNLQLEERKNSFTFFQKTFYQLKSERWNVNLNINSIHNVIICAYIIWVNWFHHRRMYSINWWHNDNFNLMWFTIRWTVHHEPMNLAFPCYIDYVAL